MPKVIIINIPMIYHSVLYVHNISLMSAASTAFILCIAMFVTKTFNLDCPYSIYIIISVIISVISVAVNISTSARKLFRNNCNFELSSGLSKCDMQGNLGDPRPFTTRKYFRYKYFRQYCMEHSSI